MMVYIAADQPPPLIPWNDAEPAFYVSDLASENDQSVRVQFSKAYIVYVGAHEGCGCGFSYGRYPEYEEPDEAGAGRESVRRLASYLSQLVHRVGPVELFASWDGKQSQPPKRKRVISPSAIGGEAFWFQEDGEFLTIEPMHDSEA